MPLLDQIRSSLCGEKEREPHPRKGTQLDTIAFFGWIIIIAYEQNRYHDVMRLFFVLCCSGCCAGAPCARASCYQLAALANRRQPQRSSSSKPTTYELTRGTSSQLSSTSSQLRGCTVALDTGIDTNKNNSFQAYVIVYLYYVKAHSVCDTFFGAIRLSVFLTNSRVLVHAPSLYRRLPVAIRLTDYLTAGSW